MNAARITAGTMSASRIYGDTLGACLINAGTVSADVILAGTMLADRLYSGTINANVLFAGTVAANAFIAGTVTAGHIAAGAIGADEIAANVIQTKHMIVANAGNSIPNWNFDTGDFKDWTPNNGSGYESVATAASQGVSTGCPSKYICVFSAGAVDIFTHADAYDGANAPRTCVQVEPGEVYFISVWAKKHASYNGSGFSFYVYGFDIDNGHTSASLGTIATTTAWQKYSFTWTVPAGWKSTSLYLYTGAFTDGALYFTNVTMRRANDATLIVDGAITADKLTANHLNAVNTESGTFQQAYTAPGDNDSTPGAGLKITGGKIEAFGDPHTFGGTIISSDGNYMITIGKALNATGLTKRYPLNNSTNFTVTGRMHFYRWAATDWIDCGYFLPGTSDTIAYFNGGTSRHGIMAKADTSGYFAVQGNHSASGGVAIKGYGHTTGGYGGAFYGDASPLVLIPSGSASAPSHSADKGSLWVTSAGVLYINTDGGTTWAKVGAQ
jgi:hypothetical protein